jgi:hypothetical protein
MFMCAKILIISEKSKFSEVFFKFFAKKMYFYARKNYTTHE